MKKVDTTPNNINAMFGLFTGVKYLPRNCISNPVLDFSSKVVGYTDCLLQHPGSRSGAQNFEWDSYINASKTFDISTQFKAIIELRMGRRR